MTPAHAPFDRDTFHVSYQVIGYATYSSLFVAPKMRTHNKADGFHVLYLPLHHYNRSTVKLLLHYG